MANTWDVTDFELSYQLNAIKTQWATLTDWEIHLFQNDYSPGPGSELTDYEECDFAGYTAEPLDMTGWGSTTIADHVAQTAQVTPAEFTADDPIGATQTVYGYYITDDVGEYHWGERFATPKVMDSGDVLQVTAQFRHRVYPPA